MGRTSDCDAARIEAATETDARERLVHGDAQKPGGEARVTAELAEMLVRAHVGVLHHVFGFVIVPGDGARRAVDASVVPAHERLEQAPFSRDDPRDDVLVGQSRRRGGGGRLVRLHGLGSLPRAPGEREAGSY